MIRIEEFERLVSMSTEDLRRMYLDADDKRDWALAWSGGKTLLVF